jgi:FlaG/FlaF family flagellin (archaellin)
MHRPIPGTDDRAISKEGMAAIGFGLTVLMMAVTGGILMQSGESLSDGGPIVTAEADSINPSNGPDGQWIRIEHKGGPTVDVSNLTVNVSVPNHPEQGKRMRATLTGLPTDGVRQSDYEGNHVFTIGANGVGGAAVASDTDRAWTAGEEIALRISDRRVDLTGGDTVRVTIHHTGSNTRLFRERISVVG